MVDNILRQLRDLFYILIFILVVGGRISLALDVLDATAPITTLVSPGQEVTTPSSGLKEIEKGKEILPQGVGREGKGKTKLPEERNVSPEIELRTTSEDGLSTFEAYIQGKAPLSISTDIRQFGYDLFEKPPTTFAPVEIFPVGPDYPLGPGDELKISIWGKATAEYSIGIDMEGKISLPQIGVLYLSGLTFAEAKETLEKEFSRYYRRGEVKINISMGRLRSIQLFVVGKARRPGNYTLSSLSTLINALFAAGGPSKIGTMRDIQVKRNGETIVHFDLYDLLLMGDKTRDIRLMPEDVIFIPTIGPLVGIAGNVRSPAIYELNGKMTLKALIEMAGGVRATGYLQRVQVERIFENEAKKILDINLKELTEQGDITLNDGDIVRVFSIIQSVTNPIELKGNLLRPGTYEWRKGIRIKDIIRSTGDLLPDTLLDFAIIERLIPPDYHKEYLSFNIGKLLLNGDEEENIPLMPHDTITIFNRWELMDKENVRVTGAVNRPGEYEYRPNMRLSDLLKLAGGLKRYALKQRAELTRVIPTLKGPETIQLFVNPEKALEQLPEQDIPLKEDDYLFVRSIPEWELYRTVTINGEVRFPGAYTIKKGELLSSLIERAGGFTKDAYLKGAVFTRESVRALQQRQLDEAIDRLEQEILSLSTRAVERVLSPEEIQQQQVVMEQRRSLLAKMRAAKAKGRISIKLDVMERFKGSIFDLPLEDGDTLMIPERPVQVQVIGAVYNQNAFLYDPDATISSYIKRAGGITRDADRDRMYILKVDGTALSRRESRGILSISWDKESNRWRGGFISVRLDPGDTIVIPEKIEKIVWLREIKDITQILYQIAVTTGVLIAAF